MSTEKGKRRLIGLEHMTCLDRQLLCACLRIIEISLHKESVERLTLAGYLQIKVCSDGINLGITHHTSLLNVLEHRTYGAIC